MNLTIRWPLPLDSVECVGFGKRGLAVIADALDTGSPFVRWGKVMHFADGRIACEFDFLGCSYDLEMRAGTVTKISKIAQDSEIERKQSENPSWASW